MTEASLILQIKALHEAYQAQLSPLVERLAEIQAKKLPESASCPSVIGLDDYVIKKIISDFEHLELRRQHEAAATPLTSHDPNQQ